MFDPADAPSPRGWSKRQANAQARNAKRDHFNELSRIRSLHFAAQRAGFASIEEHEAHKAALLAAAAAAAKPAPKAAEPAPVVTPVEPVIDDGAVEPPADAPEELEEPASAETAPVTPAEPAKAPKARRRAA